MTALAAFAIVIVVGIYMCWYSTYDTTARGRAIDLKAWFKGRGRRG